MKKTLSGLMVLAAIIAAGVFAAAHLAQPAAAQLAAAGDPPLMFENNFFVTGDYVVAGAYGMTNTFTNLNGTTYAVGTINVPDANPAIKKGNAANPGIKGITQVPAGAQIVAALLYWETVEKVGVNPGQPGSGQNGFFRPLFQGGPAAPGYALSGTALTNHTTVSFSSGGCSGGSTGKIVRVYRADVRAAIPQDADGNLLANGSYEVRLPSTGSTTPITLGATLVIVYRVLSPNVPLNSIVIYDGAFANNAGDLRMTQPIQGFYQADANAVSKLTHIVGSGQSNKFQTASLNGTNLPNIYATGQPFPGWYGNWDNTTWTFDPNHTFLSTNNPIHENDALATIQVTPSGSQAGCVSWGAVIVSTTVKNTDRDGLLDIWKLPKAPNNPARPGYCDAAVKEGVCTQGDVNWVDLPGAVLGKAGSPHPDMYVQADYMCSIVKPDGTCDTVNGYSFNPFLKSDPTDIDPNTGQAKTAVQKVIDSFAGTSGNTQHTPVTLHVIPGNAILEPTCADNLGINPHGLCAFPNQAGVVTWPGGLIFMKNQPLNYADEASCEAAANGPCIRRFQHGKDNSYRYALFAHSVGIPNWTLLGGTLANANGAIQGANVLQTGHTVTFKTTTPHMLAGNAFDTQCTQGRVTVAFAITDPTLNGTYCVAVTGLNTFTIQVSSSANFTYTAATDPNLAVMSGVADKVSGFSDIGGQNSLFGLGSWSAALQTWQTWSGTMMHEFGHLIGLTHGGFFFDSLTVDGNGKSINDNFTPTLEGNCKANHQSVMNYEFQTKLLHKFIAFDQDNKPITVQVPDFSGQTLDTLSEGAGPGSPVFSTTPAYYYTRWYEFTSVRGGDGAPAHCDGSAKLPGDVNQSMIEHKDVATALSWSVGTGQDINYDGSFETKGVGLPPASNGLRGHNDWNGTATVPGVLLNQIGATGSMSTANGAGQLGLSGGGGQLGLSGGGGQRGLSGGGGQLGLSGGGGQLGLSGGGGQLGLSGGGGQRGLSGGGGVGELTQAIEELTTDAPSNLVVKEDASPRVIRVLWTPAEGNIGSYNIYRTPAFQNGNPLNVPVGQLIFHANTNQFEFDDTVSCNPAGYTYQVSAKQAADSTNPGAESERIGPVPVAGKDPVTGCYNFAGFLSPSAGSSPLQGTVVPVAWTLQDDFYLTNGAVNNASANTLVAIGPISDDVLCTTAVGPRTTLAAAGNGIGFNPANHQFSFNWNTNNFAQGCYRLELDLDSGQPTSGGQPAAAFQVQIYLADVNESVRVATASLPDAIKGVAYNQTLTAQGDVVAPVNWTIVSGSGSLPPGILLNAATGQLTNAPTAAGTYTFTVQATDAIGDFGTKALTIVVDTVVTNTLDSGGGSLRQAILDVDGAVPGPQALRILFNIGNGGAQTIAPISALPALTQPTILDARTQPGYVATPLIELSGVSAGNGANGLKVSGGGSTVAGLVIDGFNGNGILIDTAGTNVIQANYIGTDVTGTVASGNGGNGIQIIDSPNNIIGGANAAAGNVISGNTGEGVRIDGALAKSNVVQGNYVGTNAAGSAALGNHASGVYIRRAPSNSVIKNTVSGNLGFGGITICGNLTFCGGGDNFGPGTPGNSASGNIVQGNFVGTDATGANAVGNASAGVSIDGAPNTQVGGIPSAQRNTISFNGTNDVQIINAGAGANLIQGNTIQGSTTATTVGISVDATLIGNTLTQNLISGHTGLGIDVSPSGVNGNQPGGANNYPVITSAQFVGGTTNITGTLNGPANAVFTIEFFSNPACNALGNGEGAVYLGSVSVQTDGTGTAAINFSAQGPAVGNSITSTSTDAFGTTSEFSGCQVVN